MSFIEEKFPLPPILANDSIKATKIPSSLKEIVEIEDLIWSIDNSNYEKNTSELLDKLSKNDTLVTFSIKCLDYASNRRQQNIKGYAEAYFQVAKQFKLVPNVENEYLQVILNSKGLVMKQFAECDQTCEDIYNIYDPINICYSIVWDKIDVFKQQTQEQDFDFNADYDYIPLIDIAAKYGSIECFKYMLLRGVEPTEDTEAYAVEGGNLEIIKILRENYQKKFHYMLATAVQFHNEELEEWLLKNAENEKIAIAQCLYNFNVRASLFCIENGFEINQEYEFNEGILHVFTRQFIIYI